MISNLIRRFSSGTIRHRHKILFFGTDDFSLSTLRHLNEDKKRPDGCVQSLEVCCIPMVSLKSEVKAFAEEQSLEINYWPPDVSRGKYDIGIVSSFGKLLPRKLINQFPRGVLNIHASLLPRWRGSSPIVHAILNGDKETGVSIMKIEPHKFDIGLVLAQEKIEISDNEERRELHGKLAEMGAKLMLQVLSNLDFYFHQAVPQDERLVTYAPLLHKEMHRVYWQQKTSKEIWNQYRALCDFGKLFSVWDDTNETVRFDAMMHPQELEDLISPSIEQAKPGRTFFLRHKGNRYVLIKCRSGIVSFRRFYYGKKKVMNAQDFYNGFISKYRKEGKELYFR